ncbi:hypothetical protein RHO15_02910 [Utexia brackfieldae]|uniref:hypothetical protein n=1 Tax=Utexia brackfieldae TaxID=3074108 RepID=UPI00370DB1C8
MKKFIVIVSGFLLSYSTLAAANSITQAPQNVQPTPSAQMLRVKPVQDKNGAHFMQPHAGKPAYFEIKMVTDDPVKTINDISSLMPAGKYEKYNVEVKVYPIPQGKPSIEHPAMDKTSIQSPK